MAFDERGLEWLMRAKKAYHEYHSSNDSLKDMEKTGYFAGIPHNYEERIIFATDKKGASAIFTLQKIDGEQVVTGKAAFDVLAEAKKKRGGKNKKDEDVTEDDDVSDEEDDTSDSDAGGGNGML